MLKEVLPNGLTILLSPVSTVNSVAVGVFVEAGRIHETDEQAGISHMLEHMLFKGTKTRTAKQMSRIIGGKGGDYNAYTDRDHTCYFIHTIASEVETAIDILGDMYTNSLIDPKELILEQKVVLEEIAHADEDPSDRIHDMFIAERWKGSAYGLEILGTTKSVSGFTSADLFGYMKERYCASNTVISIAGNFDPVRVIECVKRCFADISQEVVKKTEHVPVVNSYQSISQFEPIDQAYFCIGFDTVPYLNPLHPASCLLNIAYGGESYSRLFQTIREERGMAYAIGSYRVTRPIGGLLVAHGVINSRNWDTVYDIILSEMNDICKNGLTPDELELAKDTACGHSLMRHESMMDVMNHEAACEMKFGRHLPTEEIVEGYRAVTNDDIVELSNISSDSSYALILPKRGILSRIFRK